MLRYISTFCKTILLRMVIMLLAVNLFAVMLNAQSKDDDSMERINKIAEEYFYQQSLGGTQGTTPNGTEAIQEKFFTGAAASDQFGYSVSTAGDVNGDGYSDVIVGANFNDAGGSNAGRAYIYFGGTLFNSIADIILTGAAANDAFGTSVAAAGDVNGDGYSDVIVGAYQNDAGGADAGRAYIYFGGASMNNTADVTLTGAAASDNFGISVSTAGDVNGDGYSDVIVGANFNDAGGSNAGRAYIYFGSASMNNIADVTLTGANASDYFGRSVSSTGDVNGDGYSDVIVGAYLNDAGGADAGRAYIYFGGASMNNTADVTLTGAAAGDWFGWSVFTADDVNGDGYSDVIVGAYFNDAGGLNAGSAYIYFGGVIMNNTADVTLTGAAESDYFGNSVSTAGDVNGDGYSDVIVGAYFNDAGGINAGRAYIYFGDETMDNIADVTLTGAATLELFSWSVSTAGDVNGDGYVDVIVGAYGSGAGRAYLYTNSLTGTDIPDEFFTGAAASDFLGYSVSTAGDVNGDGYSDVIVGAFGTDAGGTNAGSAYIYFGGASMNSTADVTLTGAAIADNFGYSVSTAGDVNGDGYSDVIVGAYLNDAGGSNAGRAYIYFGGASMNSTADVTLTGAAASDFFGVSVSTAGDVNGDGYSDVIVGADLNDAGGIDFGSAYIYFGGASMNSIADVTLTGAATDDYFGHSVSTAGDVNADGYSDVIVGAYFDDAGGSNAGRAYIYFGGSSMNSIADLTLTGAAAGDLFGNSVSTAGDVNGDGFSDVIIGAKSNDAGGVDAGRAYIYFGGASMNSTADVTLTGAADDDEFGISVSTAGDVNNDGYSDVIVGAQYNDTGADNAGSTYIYFGGVSMNNTADLLLTGEAIQDEFGTSVSTAGDINGDGFADVIVGADENDAGGSFAGRAYLYLSSAPPVKPRIMSVKDVPGDQGGSVFVNFVRSSYDAVGINNKITEYRIEISNPPGVGGFSWSNIGSVSPNSNPLYTFIASTPYDSSTNLSGTFFYRITARTSNNNEFWRSNIISGHSVDNLSPALVMNFSGLAQGNNNKLSWKRNTEPDMKNYHIYRSLTIPIDPDTMTAVLVTTDTTGLDTSLPPGDMYYFIRARDVHDNFGPLSQISSPLPLRQINFTALIEGFYDSGSNTMVEDTVDVLLRNTTAPYTTIDQAKVKLNTSGNGLVKFRQAANSTNYYLVFKHRNSIETWSKLGQQFTNSEMTYDFTTASTKAFGDNMKLKGSKWTIFSGDVNQDGLVDLSDVSLTDIDNLNFATGYTATDVNGDNLVDLSDLSIVDINNLNFVSKVTPTFTAKPKRIEVNTLE